MSLDLFDPVKTAFSILGNYWWLYLPPALVTGTILGWLAYITQKYLLSLKWVLLEIKPPSDVQKSPKIAENIFSGLHSSYLPVKWKKRFFKGEVPNWYSLELVSNGGDIRFLIRVQEGLRTLVEHQIFAQYPDAEIKVIDDYIAVLPRVLPNNEYDLFGVDLIFNKEDAYPIKTYPFFEEESGKDEFKRTDPLSPLAEVLSALEPGEHIWLQYLIRPTGDVWAKAAQPVIDKIVGKKVEVKLNLLIRIIDGIVNAISKLFAGDVTKKDEKKEEFNVQRLTPGQRISLEQVENKISKLGFKTNIRFIYLGRKELFHRSHISSVIGMFKQLYSNNLNSFKPDRKTMTFARGYLHQFFPSDRGFFMNWQEYKLKFKLYKNYRSRTFRKKVLILNTEELATLFHLPGIGVKAPAFPRVEAKKGQPPAGLPTA